MKKNILVIKTNDHIQISNNGKKLIVDLNNKDYLKDKTKDEIIELYLKNQL